MEKDLQQQIKRWTTPSPEALRSRKEKAEFHRKKKIETSVADLRDDTLSHVYNTFGHGEGAFERCHAAGGAHPSTLKKWEDKKVLRCQTPTLRVTLWTCGKDLIIGDRKS